MYRAFLDTCVLVPGRQRDFLLMKCAYPEQRSTLRTIAEILTPLLPEVE